MDYMAQYRWFIGIILFTFIDASMITNSRANRQNDQSGFRDDDHRAVRQKRDSQNSSYTGDNQEGSDIMASSIHLLDDENTTSKPEWFPDYNKQKWYGAEFYFNRTLYKREPVKRPIVCYNNITKVENDTRILLYFICPMAHQNDSYIYCCGVAGNQSCCTKIMYDKDPTKENTEEQDLDLITGLSLAAGFAAGFTICMLLYCCCCQRRPEIHDGIKLIWVRRSFGKELSRLEQPTYPNHLAVVSSRAASRSGSRSGSHFGSHQGSRNPSRGPSPSVSRRASNDRSPSRKYKVAASTNERQKLAVDVPSSVVITVTTPSDDQGPTNPLLQSMD